MKPIHIKLCNGASVTFHYSGTIHFSPIFVIHDVLYVSEFNFNLISISRLICTLSCILTFSNDFCKSHEMNSLKMIGAAKLQEVLYHLTINKDRQSLPPGLSCVNNLTTTSISNSNIWHFRVGHLFGNYLNVLHQQFPFVSKFINETCDDRNLAKQIKFSYSPSISRASKVFELVRMNIWGPFLKTFVHGHKYFLTVLDDYS